MHSFAPPHPRPHSPFGEGSPNCIRCKTGFYKNELHFPKRSIVLTEVGVLPNHAGIPTLYSSLLITASANPKTLIN